jgi:hypothetical protein
MVARRCASGKLGFRRVPSKSELWGLPFIGFSVEDLEHELDSISK